MWGLSFLKWREVFMEKRPLPLWLFALVKLVAENVSGPLLVKIRRLMVRNGTDPVREWRQNRETGGKKTIRRRLWQMRRIKNERAILIIKRGYWSSVRESGYQSCSSTSPNQYRPLQELNLFLTMSGGLAEPIFCSKETQVHSFQDSLWMFSRCCSEIHTTKPHT